jgi:hypothetical protein
MSIWLDTIGNSVLSIAICDRCKMKRAYSDIGQDRNLPGLRVCNEGCNDERDPWRLPARQPEKITIRFPRPDADVAEQQDAITTDPYSGNNPDQAPNVSPPTPVTEGELGIAPETSEDDLDGNLDNLSP